MMDRQLRWKETLKGMDGSNLTTVKQVYKGDTEME